MSRQKASLNPIFVVSVVISLLLIVGLIKNAIGLYQSRNRLESAKATVAELKSEKDNLKKDITLQTDPVSTDQIIRNKLNVALPGDTVVVITSTESASISSAPPNISLPAPSPPPLLQWWRLFNP